MNPLVGSSESAILRQSEEHTMMNKSPGVSVNRRARRVQRWLATLTVAITAATLTLAPSAIAQGEEPPPLTAEEEYGFVEGWEFAKAHAPVSTVGMVPEQARQAILNAQTIYQAGYHPDASTGFKLKLHPTLGYPLATKDIMVDGPPGFVGSTTAVPVCPFHLFMQDRDGNCSPLSQVGIGVARVAGSDETAAGGNIGSSISSFSPIVKLPPPPDAPARFGYRTASGQVVLITPRVRSDGDYGLRLRVDNLFTNFGVLESVSTLWGNPYDPIHDSDRYSNGTPGISIPASHVRKAFLTNPTYCDSGPLERTIHARSWKWLEWTSVTVIGEQAPDQCEKLEFGGLKAPVSFTLQPDRQRASQPAGLGARLRLPFSEDPNDLARPALRNTTVELPEGVTVNPSAASGLEACTEVQIGLKSLEQPRCPDASKLATVRVTTPLLDEPLNGSMFLAEQDRNPFNSTMAMYLHVTGQGVQAKVAGRVDRDPVTGQITTTFNDSPQLPFTEMDIRFNGGDLAPVVLPTVCGQFETQGTFTPWSAPHSGPPAGTADRFEVREGADGTACVSNPAQREFRPVMRAGTSSPVAGRFSQFVARFTRTDGEQEFDRVTVKTPLGLAGKLKGIPYCPEGGIQRAINRDQSGDGKLEMADPSCGEPSRVGTTVVGVGVGPRPYYASGKVYLAGPYGNAPLSLVFVVPAVAGPFDLGVQVVRAALHVDRRTAQITAASDEIPKILEGIPLRIRDIRVLMDRPEFTLNPTNCTEQRVEATIRGAQGASSEVSNRFQIGDCAALGFNPRFNMRILDRGRRSTVRSWNPRTRFTVVPRAGDANMGPAVVTLPSSVILDQSNIRTVCTRAQFAADNCPERAIYGYAKAWSPLLDEPVEGPVYMQANGGVRAIPDIMADLRGQVNVALEGWVSTVRRGGTGRLRNTFNVVPDVPVTRFELTMRGGRTTGLLVNSTDLCRSNERGVANFRSANGKRSVQRPRIGMTFRGCRKVRRQAARRAAKRKAARKSAVRRIVRRAALGREVR